MRSLTALGARIERLAAEQGGQSIGAQVADILDGKGPRAPIPDEVLARSATGRVLLERRRRTEANYPG
jgi:hypothetical protein